MLEGVYHPERLEVLDRCRRLRGTVILVRGEGDGDLHFDVELDRRYRGVLLPGNLSRQGGALLVEYIPRDGAHLRAPSVGDRVRMVGALVNDSLHHWAELHPVWAIQINGGRWSRSGPRFGGSRPQDRSYNAAGDCTTPRGAACRGYGATSEGGYCAAGALIPDRGRRLGWRLRARLQPCLRHRRSELLRHPGRQEAGARRWWRSLLPRPRRRRDRLR